MLLKPTDPVPSLFRREFVLLEPLYDPKSDSKPFLLFGIGFGLTGCFNILSVRNTLARKSSRSSLLRGVLSVKLRAKPTNGLTLDSCSFDGPFFDAVNRFLSLRIS